MKTRSRAVHTVIRLLVLVVCSTGGLVYAAGATPATAPAGTTSQAQPTSSEQVLINLERDWWAAYKNRDRAALENILADEYFGIDNAAAAPTFKRAWINDAVNGATRVESYTLEHFDVRVIGDAAVVAVRYSLHSITKGVGHDAHSVDMDTFVRRNGRWQALATAEVSLAAPK